MLTENEALQIEPPELPAFPAPIVIGRTLSIDLGRGWWSRWFSATRKPDTIIKEMRGAMAREMAPLLREIELEHATAILAGSKAKLAEFFSEHGETLHNLCSLDDISSAAQTREQLGLAGQGLRGLAAIARLGGLITRLSLTETRISVQKSGV